MDKMSMSHEDYLEAMVMLGASQTTGVRSVDVAEKLGVSKASVSKAVAGLREAGYLDQAHYGSITLTERGLERGCAVLERHEMLTRFLSKGLGIAPEVAEHAACQMEHAISDDSFKKWFAFVEKLGLD